MQLVRIDESSGSVYWDEYFDYLRAHEHLFDCDLYAYASDWNNYSLEGRSSLHDSWLSSLHLTWGRGKAPKSLRLEFLGSYHDRLISLLYDGISDYSVRLESSDTPGGKDVFVHEFLVSEKHFSHEVLFVSGSRLFVRFQGFAAKESPISEALQE